MSLKKDKDIGHDPDHHRGPALTLVAYATLR
jgi:hypothetical protein